MNDASGTDTTSHKVAAVVPRATYRLQLRREFNFKHAKAVLPYLSALGISHLYLSPIFAARPGSTSGYDVINHREINPDLGTLEEFKDLATTARAHGLGIVLDIVPNHMAVACSANEWWQDVLENGPAAKHANYFDIDWTPLRESMRNRLLLPVLESRYGDELNAGRIRIEFDASHGSFFARYHDQHLPIDPQLYPDILEEGVVADSSDPDEQDFQNIVAEFRRLPSRCDLLPEAIEQRYRDKEVLKRRLARLCARYASLPLRIEQTTNRLNGRAGDPASLDNLAALLNKQVYRLAYWKVAGDEINYRRFFDVNQLAALRVENPEVFEATHRLVLDLIRDGFVDGLRVDHIDGLHVPSPYLKRLREETTAAGKRDCYLVVEKILASHERLRDEWPVQGTTGYEFAALVASWLTSESGVVSLDWAYRQFTRGSVDYGALVYECKKLLMRTSLAAEISVLGVQLDRIAQAHRDTADFTHHGLRDALTEVIAAFPVYRTYVDRCAPGPDDVQSISWAVGAARSRSKGSDRTIFNFIEDVLLCKESVATHTERRNDILEFTRKFQQVTAPVMAKSVEDTAFYRYGRLLALNDVGGDPRSIGLATGAFHRIVADRHKHWPHTLLATSTHDSKRGEDVRYRLFVLTELPKLWRTFVNKLSRLNRGKRVESPEPTPSLNDEYFLLQTLAGMWPVQDDARTDEGVARLKEYAVKAAREAKERTSWIDPDPNYEAALTEFIDAYVQKPRKSRFQTLLREGVEPLAFFGMLNGLAALILKLTVPGVPDFYQGSEFVELTLVDPDNRRLVEFGKRAELCDSLTRTGGDGIDPAEPLRARDYDAAKFICVWRLLQLRRTAVDLFTHAGYEPLDVRGKHAAHVCAFLRSWRTEAVVVIVTRWAATLTGGRTEIPMGELWADTCVALPERLRSFALDDVLHGRAVPGDALLAGTDLLLANLFVALPAAVINASPPTRKELADNAGV